MKKLAPIILLILLISACQPRQNQIKISFSGMAQGTYYGITYFDHLDRNFQPEIDSLLDAFDMSVSMWEPASIISRINRGEENVHIDSIFITTYIIARKVAEESTERTRMVTDNAASRRFAAEKLGVVAGKSS